MDQALDSKLTRRRLLALAAAGAPALAAGGRLGWPSAAAAAGPIVKPLPPEWFVALNTNAEMRWDAAAELGYRIPNERFFVRNHTSTPLIDPATWRLRVFGSGLRRPEGREFSLRELRRMPARSITAALREVLERAGLSPRAVEVMPEGLDAVVGSQGHVRRPLPVEKALDDVLLAYEMNGEPLPPDHGAPVRVVVPGWIGVASIKWVGSIEVADHPLVSAWNTTQYRMTGPTYRPDEPPLTTQAVKSAFELPFGAIFEAGRRHELTGRSWSGRAPIRRVDVSTDGGASYAPVRLHGPNRPNGWVRWRIPFVENAPGTYQLLARATDEADRTQPDTVPFNDSGYLFGAVVRHPVEVRA